MPVSLLRYVRTNVFIIAVFIIGVAIFWAYVLEGKNGMSSKEVSVTTSVSTEQTDWWAKRIQTIGGKAAYEEFADFVESDSIAKRHERAHFFGAALYAVEGMEGLSVCDARFSYGCFHEFLGRAIAEHGLAAVPELNQGCVDTLVKSPLSCQHGIGHGVMAFLGYEGSDLLKALEVCEHIPYSDPIGGCYGGVFMEYNLRTMLGTDGRLREFKGDVHEPCDALFDPFQVPCVYWQPQWWHQTLFSGFATFDSYTKMGDYCREIGVTEKLLRPCFEGLGTITAQASGYDPGVAAKLCEKASKTEHERLYCDALTANSFGIEVDTPTAENVCKDFKGDSLEYCLAYARNEANILAVRSPPSL